MDILDEIDNCIPYKDLGDVKKDNFLLNNLKDKLESQEVLIKLSKSEINEQEQIINAQSLEIEYLKKGLNNKNTNEIEKLNELQFEYNVLLKDGENFQIKQEKENVEMIKGMTTVVDEIVHCREYSKSLEERIKDLELNLKNEKEKTLDLKHELKKSNQTSNQWKKSYYLLKKENDSSIYNYENEKTELGQSHQELYLKWKSKNAKLQQKILKLQKNYKKEKKLIENKCIHFETYQKYYYEIIHIIKELLPSLFDEEENDISINSDKKSNDINIHDTLLLEPSKLKDKLENLLIHNENLFDHNKYLENFLVQQRMQHADLVNVYQEQTSEFQRVVSHVDHVDGVMGEIIRQVICTQKNINGNGVGNKEENNTFQKFLRIASENHESLTDSFSTIQSSNYSNIEGSDGNNIYDNSNVCIISPSTEDEIECKSRLGVLCRTIYALIQQYKSIESKNFQYDALLKRAIKKLNKVDTAHSKDVQGYQRVIEKMKDDHQVELQTLSASKRVLERSIETSDSELRHLVTDILTDSTDYT